MVAQNQGLKEDRPTAYSSTDGAIVGRNMGRFNNRPVYANNRDDLLIGGDRPIVRFGRRPFLFGSMMLGFVRGELRLWLHDADEITFAYRAGRLSWRIQDKRLPDTLFVLDAVPTIGTTGMALRLQAEGVANGDRFIGAFGGALAGLNPNAVFDSAVSSEITKRGFLPTDCIGNTVTVQDQTFIVSGPATSSLEDEKKQITGYAIGRCGAPSSLSVRDARFWSDLSISPSASQSDQPLLFGETLLASQPVYWGIIGSPETPNAEVNDPERLFSQGWQRSEELAQRIVLATPEKRLDALASASVAAIDGTWYPPYFVHSAMLWNRPFPGWRTIFGGTMFGWHDRVRETAKYFISSQVVESTKTRAEADPAHLLTIQSENSRFYGRGRITAHSGFYDMQSQFFDQLITEWRWSTDPDYEKLLRPALELHLEWLKDCFDPDDDGAYESYINSWPTDSVWYNGGGSCEATSYAFRGHLAARDMAKKAGDRSRELHHDGMLEKIRRGFFEQLWVDRLGHPGKYREQGGHRRLHEDPWLYSLFLPIDAGLVSSLQAASTLNYAGTRLQNDLKPFGGRMVWNSNWVPAIWSTRTDWPGDNYALALAYFQSGFGEDAWNVFKGTFLSSAFDSPCPGNLGHKAGGYDFGDCAHTFTRTLVEGLFGYRPDYPNGVVRVAPQFPEEWDYASISLPDVALHFSTEGDLLKYDIELKVASALELQIPIRAEKIIHVFADGASIPYKLISGLGYGILFIELPLTLGVKLSIKIAKPFSSPPPIEVSGIAGEKVTVELEVGVLESVPDPQGLFANLVLADNRFTAELKNNPAPHFLIAETKIGTMPVSRAIKLNITAKDEASSLTINDVPEGARWKLIDLGLALNADVRSIFKQEYLSPRPETVSLRLGTDGWSPWTSTFWKQQPPIISLENVASLLNAEGSLVTPQNAHFAWPGKESNIAFTSLWDNFPSSVSIHLEAAAEAIWLLVAGSTNPMQCQIANAAIRLTYADGKIETLELIPPKNFWALAPLAISGTEGGQEGRFDYTDSLDAFCVPPPHPACVQLGTNCRAMVYGLKLRPDVPLESVTLETLSQEVVIGLMGISLMNPEGAQIS